MAARWLRSLAAAPLMLGGLLAGVGSAALSLTAPTPARALVPYVLMPSEANLEGAGLGIAQAAARLLRLGQAEDAARLAALVVQLIPADPRGWVLLAEAELRSGQEKQAGVALARARELDPNNAGILFAQGSLALKDNNPTQAADLIRQGLKLDGRNAGAYFDLGNAHILMGRNGEALAAFEKAAGLRKDFWEAINNQALVLYEQGKTPEAIKRWRRVLTISPTASEPMLALAAALNSEKPGNSESLELAHQALAGEPNYVLDSYQKEQLWGSRLRAATATLLAEPALKPDVDRAQANAGSSSDDGEE
ncbi:MAG: tetratricopeptide repeat protein [Vulcanococcus sp.]